MSVMQAVNLCSAILKFLEAPASPARGPFIENKEKHAPFTTHELLSHCKNTVKFRVKDVCL